VVFDFFFFFRGRGDRPALSLTWLPETLAKAMEGDISSVPLLETRRLSPWLTCVCVFVFDLERGQALETVYPPACLPQATLELIKFLAFPDSNTGMHASLAPFPRIRSVVVLCGTF
jgi:hypothetical protein